MRTYPLPAAVLDELEPTGPLLASVKRRGSMTSDEIERAAFVASGTGLGDWADRFMQRQARQSVKRLMGGSDEMPQALVYSDDVGEIAVGLTAGGRVYDKDGWRDAAAGELDYAVELDLESIAFVASALDENADGVVLRPWVPLAFLAAAPPQTASDQKPESVDAPEGAVVAAVVDEVDNNAVLDLLAIGPGPTIYRRNAGVWEEDPGWIDRLRGIDPPPMVTVGPDKLSSVVSQVDESTAGQPFEPTEAPIVSSAMGAAEWEKADEFAVQMALVAAKAANKVAGKAGGAENLRQYWLHGKGAMKIRWGTPGDWKRCVRQLTKYLGVRAKGYCQLMHGRATGTWAGKDSHKKAPSPAVKAKAIAKQFSR